jgi:hypothetical protein
MARYRPALIGGVFIGVLSALPMVSAANVCCCLWVVAGGVLAVYLQQQNMPEPIEAGDAAVSGLIAGLVGAIITVVINQLLLSVTGPIIQEQVQRALESNPDVPPEVRDMVTRFTTGGGVLPPDLRGLRLARRLARHGDLQEEDAAGEHQRAAAGATRYRIARIRSPADFWRGSTCRRTRLTRC